MGHQFQGAMLVRMSSGREVMTELNDVTIELFIIRDIEFSLVIDESMLFFPFKDAIHELTRSFGFKKLESLSHKRLTIDIFLDAFFNQWCRSFGRAEIKC
jgi:hypothetical protein